LLCGDVELNPGPRPAAAVGYVKRVRSVETSEISRKKEEARYIFKVISEIPRPSRTGDEKVLMSWAIGVLANKPGY